MVVGEIQEGVDVVVIGAGPGGYVAAIRAAQLGREVHLVEAMDRLGGVCLNWGCIPSKALIHVANFYAELDSALDFGVCVEKSHLDFQKVQDWKDNILARLSKGIEQLCVDNGITLHRGIAHFTSKNSIRIEGEEGAKSLSFKNTIVATGSQAIEVGDIPFSEAKGIVSSKGAIHFHELPKRLAVIGGGYIGIELGTAFAKLGSEVTIVEALDRILPEIDEELAKPVARRLKKLGVKVLTSAKATGFEGGMLQIEGQEAVAADKLLIAVGRRPNTEGLDLKAAGITADDKGFIKVDASGRSSNKHVFAIGDVVGGLMLAHKASAEGKVAAEALCGHSTEFDGYVPAVIFSDPELASVGLTELQAKERGIEVKTGQFPFAALGRAMASNATDGFVKVVSDAASQRLLGIQIVGAHASELIATATHALELGALTEDLAMVINAHPTFSEAIGEAVESIYGKAIHISPRKQKK